MNKHCQSCLNLNGKKWLICGVTLLDFVLAVRQIMFIEAEHEPQDNKMLAIVLGRVAITWILFAVGVTTLNRMLNCHTTKGEWNTANERTAATG